MRSIVPQRIAQKQPFHATRIVACAPMRHHGKPITSACNCSWLIVSCVPDPALAQMNRPWCSRRAHSQMPMPSCTSSLMPIRPPIDEEVGVMRTRFAEYAHHARQRRFRSGAHVQRLDRQPHRVDADHRSNSRSHACAVGRCRQRPVTFTTVAPRRSSITIACAVAIARALAAGPERTCAFSTVDRAGAALDRLDRPRRLRPLLGHHPAPQQVRVQPVAERHRGDRHARLAAGRHHLRLELRAMRASTPPSDCCRCSEVSTCPPKTLSGHDPP